MAVLEERSSGHTVASLRDVILGGQDGLVNVLGLVLGMAAATGDGRVVVTAALAAMFAESIAMAGVAFTATGAEREWAWRTRKRLTTEMAARAEARRQERCDACRAAGYTEPEINLALLAHDEEAVAWMDELVLVERELAPVRATHPARSALTVGLSTIAGSAVPLSAFLVLPVAEAIWVSLAAGAIVLFCAGLYRARLAGTNLVASGVQMATIGLVSAFAGFLIGHFLRAPIVG
jgi:vacuolar iron transporter family protein